MIPQTDAISPLHPGPCPRCGVIDTPAVGPGFGPHTARARWAPGGCFLPWTSTRPPAMAQKPPSQLQLASVQALGDDGPVPGSMAEASTRIDARVRREVA